MRKRLQRLLMSVTLLGVGFMILFPSYTSSYFSSHHYRIKSFRFEPYVYEIEGSELYSSYEKDDTCRRALKCYYFKENLAETVVFSLLILCFGGLAYIMVERVGRGQ